MQPSTFLYLFYFNRDISSLTSLPRIQGFCWEPSCWNLLVNFHLVFVLYFKENWTSILLTVFSLFFIMSTTGLVVMLLVVSIYYLMSIKTKYILRTVIAVVIVTSFALPFVYRELSQKLETGSGLARLGDMAIAVAIIQDSPVLGSDLDNITNNELAMRARENQWGKNRGDYRGYMEQGMVNSFASLFVEWGAPFALLILSMTFATPFIGDNKLRVLIFATLVGVILGTPITRTGFFFFFPLSTFLVHRRKRLKKKRVVVNSLN